MSSRAPFFLYVISSLSEGPIGDTKVMTPVLASTVNRVSGFPLRVTDTDPARMSDSSTYVVIGVRIWSRISRLYSPAESSRNGP